MSAPGPDHPGLDTTAVTAWLMGLGLGAREPIRFQRIGQGQSNLTFRVDDASAQTWVLRRPPMGQLLASAHDVAREHRILRALEPAAVPTPAVVGFTDDPVITDVPLLLMEHVEGRVISDSTVVGAMHPRVRGSIGRSLTSALAAIHAVDLDATGLSTLSSHQPYAARQIKRWRLQWEQSRTYERPQVESLADRLEAAAPPHEELTLVHGDFHLLNVIVDGEIGEVRSVLDWELCTLGDPLADLGVLLAYWSDSGDASGSALAPSTIAGFPSGAQLAHDYGTLTGRDLETLPFWHALALWKVGVIAEGVRRRASRDRRNALGGTLSASLVDSFFRRAEDVATKAGF